MAKSLFVLRQQRFFCGGAGPTMETDATSGELRLLKTPKKPSVPMKAIYPLICPRQLRPGQNFSNRPTT
jgi:hypothetical protein